MDLPQLLEPERIRCRCEIHSKKRALQTVAELLGASLREASASSSADGEDAHGERSSANGRREERRSWRAGRRDKEGARRNGRARGGAEEGAESAAGVSDMEILDALISRERLGSTGLGHGVALPHSRLDVVDAPLAAMITLNDGVDFEASDGEPVDLVLGLLVPRDCNDEHLAILANLARRFSDAELRDALRECETGEELFARLERLADAR